MRNIKDNGRTFKELYMKSNIAFISKDMERAGQYSTKSSAQAHAKTIVGRRHKIISAVCYRMIDNEPVKYRCYTPVLQN